VIQSAANTDTYVRRLMSGQTTTGADQIKTGNRAGIMVAPERHRAVVLSLCTIRTNARIFLINNDGHMYGHIYVLRERWCHNKESIQNLSNIRDSIILHFP